MNPETTEVTDRWSIATFDHPRNITFGNGRLIWGRRCTDCSGIHHPEGWILPGGARTDDAEVAHAVVRSINEMSRKV